MAGRVTDTIYLIYGLSLSNVKNCLSISLLINEAIKWHLTIDFNWNKHKKWVKRS